MSSFKIVNKIKCNNCGDIIESKHRHDFVFCSCGHVAVDGGSDYLKRTGNTEDYTEESTIELKLTDYWEIINLLKTALEAFNTIPNTKLTLSTVKSTYELASLISKFLKTVYNV